MLSYTPIFVGQLIAIALDSTSIDVFMMIWRCSYTTEEDDWMRIGLLLICALVSTMNAPNGGKFQSSSFS
jgi:hypothetical protein